MARIIYLFLGVLTFIVSREDDASLHYIETHKHIAIEEMHRSGIPASLILAQGMLETNSGKSVLAIKAHNHFGIKCKSYWEGPKYYRVDDDRDRQGNLIKSCFRVYNNATESFRDHSNFLKQSDRYGGLFAFEVTDYENWAHGLQICGYATDKKYAEKIIARIKQYRLYNYDTKIETNQAHPTNNNRRNYYSGGAEN